MGGDDPHGGRGDHTRSSPAPHALRWPNMHTADGESVDLEAVAARFRAVAPAADFCSLRMVEERDEHLSVRRGVVQPPHVTYDSGAMVTVWRAGGVGYAATSDLTAAGLRRAAAQALDWARLTAGRHLLGESGWWPQVRDGEYASRVETAWAGTALADEGRPAAPRSGAPAGGRPHIVDWEAGLWHTALDTLLVTADGGRIRQHFQFLSADPERYGERRLRRRRRAPSAATPSAARAAWRSCTTSASSTPRRASRHRRWSCWRRRTARPA